MGEEHKLEIKYARLLGEYVGNLKGILHWDIPQELAVKLEARIEELEKIEVFNHKLTFSELMSTDNQ